MLSVRRPSKVKRWHNPEGSLSSDDPSKLSASYFIQQIENMKMMKNRKSTYENYHRVWKLFNQFLLQLDHMPNSWEDRAALFCVYMTQRGAKSATLRSYISAIKCVLKDDDYEWNDNVNNDNE